MNEFLLEKVSLTFFTAGRRFSSYRAGALLAFHKRRILLSNVSLVFARIRHCS